ncbi:MAG: AI-2E family transporter [Parachlamydia sp.]|nr:AI-2E family transporter [Parachlamydia sp.]
MIHSLWFEGTYYKYSVGIILALLIVLLLYYTSPFFSPILWFATAIFLPILFSTFLYYILRPVVTLLKRWMPAYLAVLLIYFFLALIIAAVVFIFAPEAIEAISHISPESIASLKENAIALLERVRSYFGLDFSYIEETISAYSGKLNAFISHAILDAIKSITSIAISLFLTPFVLFYFLKDDHLFSKSVLRFVPKQFKEETQVTLRDMDSALAEFIQAQLTLAAVVGIFLLCGYILIGLPHAISLALFATVFYVIPFLGTFIALIPAAIVALSINMGMLLKVILVMFVAHFLEANILTPRLMSNRLNIHPLTIILLLLAAGSLFGLLGMLLVTPTFAVLKVVSWNLFKIFSSHWEKSQKSVLWETEGIAEK